MVLFIDKLPVNEEMVVNLLYPRLDVTDDPEEIILQKTVIIDTPLHYVGEFVQLVRQLRASNVICILATNYPFQFASDDIPLIDVFNLVLFFDVYSLFIKPFAIEASKRSIFQVCRIDISLLPRIASLSYTEIKFREDNLTQALLALQRQTDSFNFCLPLSQKAKARGQYKTLVSCPHFLEVKVQECLRNTIVVEDESQTIKVSRIYWLTKQQMLGDGNSMAEKNDGRVK